MNVTFVTSTSRTLIQNTSSTAIVIFSLLAILENVFVIGLLYRYSVLQETSSKIFASMTASNFFTALLGLSSHSFLLLRQPAIGGAYDSCFLIIDKFLKRLCIGISTYTMSDVAFEGSLQIYSVLPSYHLHSHLIYVGIILAWMVPIGVFISCLPFTYMAEYGHVEAIVFSADIVQLIVFSISFICISLSTIHQICQLSSKDDLIGLQRGNKRQGVAAFLLATTYIFMNGPALIANLGSKCSLEDKSCFELHTFCDIMINANPMINPLLLFLTTQALRKYFFLFLRMVSIGYRNSKNAASEQEVRSVSTTRL